MSIVGEVCLDERLECAEWVRRFVVKLRGELGEDDRGDI